MNNIDRTSKDVVLLDCPFCGGVAETDSQQAYRAIGTGNIGYAAAVYCTGSCSAQMSLCYADVPDLPRERVLEVLIENWNRRRGAVETSDKPVAWRYLADSAYEQRPRWVYFEENTPTVRLVAEGRTLEPLYSRGSPEEPAETHYWAEMRRCCTCQGNTIDPKCPVAFPHPWNRAQVKASASHVHVWEKRGDFGGASCKCGTRADGWYCPDSPDHLCHYEKGNFDQCDFCGLPEERK